MSSNSLITFIVEYGLISFGLGITLALEFCFALAYLPTFSLFKLLGFTGILYFIYSIYQFYGNNLKEKVKKFMFIASLSIFGGIAWLKFSYYNGKAAFGYLLGY